MDSISGTLAGMTTVFFHAGSKAKKIWDCPIDDNSLDKLKTLFFKPFNVGMELLSTLELYSTVSSSPSFKFISVLASSLSTTLDGAFGCADLISLAGRIKRSIRRSQWGTCLFSHIPYTILVLRDVQEIFSRCKPDWSSLRPGFPLFPLAPRILQADLSKSLMISGISCSLFSIWDSYIQIDEWNETVDKIKKEERLSFRDMGNVESALQIAVDVTFLAYNL